MKAKKITDYKLCLTKMYGPDVNYDSPHANSTYSYIDPAPLCSDLVSVYRLNKKGHVDRVFYFPS